MNAPIPMSAALPLAVVAALLFAGIAAAYLALVLCKAWDKSRAGKFGRYVFFAAVAGATLYGGAKHGSISFPYTDPEVKYIMDAGSYVTNDAIHVAYSRMIAPTSAPLVIDYRELGKTNDTDWVTLTNTTFAAFPSPQDVPFPAATNYDWIVYTTWTPGPTVQTNGVWHAYWGVDQKSHRYYIPIRTCVREDATIIATPKSVWDAEKK